jgi:hypothetical protein
MAKSFQAAVLACLLTYPFTIPAAPNMLGNCKFDTNKLTFPGSAQEQAKCLLRPVKMMGNLGPVLNDLPKTLKQLVGQDVAIDRSKIRALLTSFNLKEDDLGGSLDGPLSRAHNNASSAPMARYFVIHDTSQFHDGSSFPANDDGELNNLVQFKPKKAAHLFNNRLAPASSSFYAAHDFDTPWRATQLELKTGVAAKGLFIHVENVQPRRRNPANPKPNDNLAPDPGFTDAQYTKLALAYIVASRRAGTWMIPAFHAVLDSGGVGDHDDPQNFDLEKFDAELGNLIGKLSN